MSDLPDRTPMVFMELQLRPAPPSESEPYFWGDGMLDFRLGGSTVWRGQLPTHMIEASRPSHVEKRDGYGWVLVLCYSHDVARRVLKSLGLPSFIDAFWQSAP